MIILPQLSSLRLMIDYTVLITGKMGKMLFSPNLRNSGFSLIELSIVLVILGLLTGGILAGQSLIRASQLRAVTTEYPRYIATVQAFKDKYFALPGDMANAIRFWGALDNGDGLGSDCRGESSGLLTCNGDGNGSVYYNTSDTTVTMENYLFWKHLANAGLIEGGYPGNGANIAGNSICINSSYGAVGGCNVPSSKLGSNTMWNIIYYGNVTGDSYLFDGEYGHALVLNASPGWFNPIGPILQPEELWNIDSKMDDGKPASGRLIGSRWNQCTTGASSVSDGANASYALTNKDLRCVAVFRNFP
jgi:prepilin-type N-terminal cleavage/methylation domain-containing protein